MSGVGGVNGDVLLRNACGAWGGWPVMGRMLILIFSRLLDHDTAMTFDFSGLNRFYELVAAIEMHSKRWSAKHTCKANAMGALQT